MTAIETLGTPHGTGLRSICQEGSDPRKELLAFVWENHADYLARTCNALCKRSGRCWADAEDLFSATLCKIADSRYAKWPPLAVAFTKEWHLLLSAIARNLLLDELQRLKRRKKLELEFGVARAVNDGQHVGHGIIEEESYETVCDTLNNRCSVRMREVVLLRMAATTWADIAARIDLSVAAVKRDFAAAIRILRAALEVNVA
jgi:RNA polymerase sigma factor (sigma-70 family)